MNLSGKQISEGWFGATIWYVDHLDASHDKRSSATPPCSDSFFCRRWRLTQKVTREQSRTSKCAVVFHQPSVGQGRHLQITRERPRQEGCRAPNGRGRTDEIDEQALAPNRWLLAQPCRSSSFAPPPELVAPPGEGKTERYTEIAAEFVRLNVDVIVTTGAAVPTLKQAIHRSSQSSLRWRTTRSLPA